MRNGEQRPQPWPLAIARTMVFQSDWPERPLIGPALLGKRQNLRHQQSPAAAMTRKTEGIASVGRRGMLRRRVSRSLCFDRDSDPPARLLDCAQGAAGPRRPLRAARRIGGTSRLGSAPVQGGSSWFTLRCRLKRWEANQRGCRSGHSGFALRAAGSVRLVESPRHCRQTDKDGGTSRVAVHLLLDLQLAPARASRDKQPRPKPVTPASQHGLRPSLGLPP